MPADDPELDALLTALQLKDVDRAGWVRKGVRQPESVAAHSWGVAWLVVALAPAHLDRARALTYAVLHDLAEATVGDLTPHDGVPAHEKARREADAIAALTSSLPPHIATAWHAYEAQADNEARFVRELDRLDMALQAVAYAARGDAGMPEFLTSAASAIRDPMLVDLLARAKRRLTDLSR